MIVPGRPARGDGNSRLNDQDGMMFRERLDEILNNDHGSIEATAVLAIGVEKLKAIKTSLGRTVCNALLSVVADRLRSEVQDEDILGRISDDEFGIVQVNAPQPHGAMKLAQRIVDLLGRSYLVEGQVLNIDVSVGIALIAPGDKGGDQILHDAESAMACAGADGPGRYRFFDVSMAEKREARHSLEVELRRALTLREFEIVYQPQFNLCSSSITGFEALIRWRNPKHGFVSPADFIPLAEELGLIAPIGQWVLQTACREAAGWPANLKIAVNVSALQFRNADLCDHIASALSDSGLDPARLELEITESVLISDHAAVLDLLSDIRQMGVSISMDDFGTGYSSLSSLRSFPFSKLKIDQSFVRSGDALSGEAIVRAVAALGHSLGMTTIAEGVETEGQLARVIAAGCKDIQGYLISKPLRPEQVAEFLRSRDRGLVATSSTQKD